jgi:V8-like Glu-specific endopeptidase
MRGRGRFAVLGAGLIVGLTVATTGGAMAAKPAQTAHQRTLAYWTAARIANAKPRDFVRTPAGGFQKAQPNAKPSRPGGGGTGSVTGASWTQRGQIQVTSGKVLFTLNSGDYICSGTVVNDNQTNVSIVLTAGHCGYDGSDGGFARNWTFYPDFDDAPTYTCASSTYGCWTAQALVLDSGFTSAGGFNTQATKHDWTFAVVGSGGKSNTQLDATVGSFAISFSTASGTTYAFGYPAAGKYNGSDLTYCKGTPANDVFNGNATIGMACDMTGGSSGGPWLTGFSEATGAGTLNGLNSYGYSGIKNMYGPKFNANTQATFNRANTAPTSNQIVNVAP